MSFGVKKGKKKKKTGQLREAPENFSLLVLSLNLSVNKNNDPSFQSYC
jgi:hypothetical protein